MNNNLKAYHLILKNHTGGGFFSVFNKIINNLQFYFPIYKITWDVVDERNYYGNGEMFNKIFEVYIDDQYKEYNITDIFCIDYYDDRICGPNANYMYREDMYKYRNIWPNWRELYNKIWSKYIIIKPEILEIFNKFKESMIKIKKKQIITFLVRHPVLNNEQLHKKLPSFQQYDDEINNLTNNDLNNTLLICCTDSEEAYNYFSKTYKNNIIFPPSYRAKNTENEAHRNYHDLDDKLYQAILCTLYLTIGDFFIHPNSNMAIAAMYINPNLKNIFLIG